MPDQHHDLSPSSFPAWAVCPSFTGDSAPRADSDEGTKQHAALEAILDGNLAPLDGLTLEAREAIRWAGDYVTLTSGGQKILREQRVAYSVPDNFASGGVADVFFGTADAVAIHPPGNTADLIDFKSGAGGDRSHRQQLAGYALALFSMRRRLKTIRCHVLYGRNRYVDSWSLTQAAAAGIVIPILEARQHPDRPAVACDYCTFCRHRATCSALTDEVALVAPDHGELITALRDPAAIADPAIAGQALTVARNVATWAEAVRKAATGLAKEGATVPGYRLQERRGSRDVTDINEAFARTGLAAADFLAACKVSLPKLADIYAKACGVPKKQAAAAIETALAGLVKEGTPAVALVADKTTE